MAASFRAIFPAFLIFRNRGNRGDHTFCPQTPPSISPDGLLQQLNLDFRLNFAAETCQLGLKPIGLLHSAEPRKSSLKKTSSVAYVREQEWVLYVCNAVGVRSQARM